MSALIVILCLIAFFFPSIVYVIFTWLDNYALIDLGEWSEIVKPLCVMFQISLFFVSLLVLIDFLRGIL